MKSIADVVVRAEQFAREAHAGMLLQSGGLFVTHLEEVVALVIESRATQEELAAAWLHDVVEDTKFTLLDIRKEFGDFVATIVDGLTDLPDFAAKPNKIRKRLQAERIRDKSREVKHIKIADQTANVLAIAFKPPSTWSYAERLDYMNGAKLIADECGGISELLDKKFEESYRIARQELRMQ